MNSFLISCSYRSLLRNLIYRYREVIFNSGSSTALIGLLNLRVINPVGDILEISIFSFSCFNNV